MTTTDAPASIYVDMTHDDGLEIIVHVTTEGIVVDFFDAGRLNATEGVCDPYKTVAIAWEQMDGPV